jgi:hypothetical protein
MAARIGGDFPEPEKREVNSPEKDRADGLFVGEDEIGLLDIVLMDAIAKSGDTLNG